MTLFLFCRFFSQNVSNPRGTSRLSGCFRDPSTSSLFVSCDVGDLQEVKLPCRCCTRLELNIWIRFQLFFPVLRFKSSEFCVSCWRFLSCSVGEKQRSVLTFHSQLSDLLHRTGGRRRRRRRRGEGCRWLSPPAVTALPWGADSSGPPRVNEKLTSGPTAGSVWLFWSLSLYFRELSLVLHQSYLPNLLPNFRLSNSTKSLQCPLIVPQSREAPAWYVDPHTLCVNLFFSWVSPRRRRWRCRAFWLMEAVGAGRSLRDGAVHTARRAE